MKKLLAAVVSLSFLSCAHTKGIQGIKCHDFPYKEETTAYEAVGQIIINESSACTATLIDKRVIVTAAHCFRGWTFVERPEARFYVGGRVHHIDQVVVDDPDNSIYDIAFASLKEESSVKPIPIASLLDVARFSGKYEFVGYGCNVSCHTLDNEGLYFGFGIKRKIEVTVKDRLILAGFTERFTLCPGDSGGPVIDKKTGKIIAVAHGGFFHNGENIVTMFAVAYLYESRIKHLFS